MTIDPEMLLTVAEAAKATTLTEPQIRSRIRDGRLPSLRIGGSIFVEWGELMKFVKPADSK
jgi:excisionase family DNA binding protein